MPRPLPDQNSWSLSSPCDRTGRMPGLSVQTSAPAAPPVVLVLGEAEEWGELQTSRSGGGLAELIARQLEVSGSRVIREEELRSEGDPLDEVARLRARLERFRERASQLEALGAPSRDQGSLLFVHPANSRWAERPEPSCANASSSASARGSMRIRVGSLSSRRWRCPARAALPGRRAGISRLPARSGGP
mgnify:CR=1 FL=1